MICYLDMDGCTTSFVKGACKVHSIDYDDLLSRWPAGQYDFGDMFGMPAADFYAPMEEDYWANLEPTSECFDIVKLVESVFGAENVYILTKATLNHGAFSGKSRWVEKHLPDYVKRLIVMRGHKPAAVGTGNVLVDDDDRNVDGVNGYGSRGILIPRIWNSRHHEQFSLPLFESELKSAKFAMGGY